MDETEQRAGAEGQSGPAPGAGAEIAAVDLGSNSFHMVVAREHGPSLTVVDRLREMVRLASALDDRNVLGGETVERALECLARFGQRLRGLHEHRVRAVGTNTLRKAKNAPEFLRRAEAVLGYSIGIVSGYEEARLIYLGVSQSLQEDRGRRLVVDIGGGSTEVIIGDRGDPLYMESLYMGCVGHSRQFFSDGKITRGRMRKALLAAGVEIEPIAVPFRRAGWNDAIGSSGTIRAIERVIRESGWDDTGITLPALERLADTVVAAGHADRLRLAGLGPGRTPVFAGGVAVLLALFRELGIERMRVSEGSLREGVLYDLVGRMHHDDARWRAVEDLGRRFQVDAEQGRRIEESAASMFRQVAPAWSLGEDGTTLLGWACRLHEIGLIVSHTQYHKHGAYLLQNLALPGFSRQEQTALSILVRLHRRKFQREVLSAAPNGHGAELEKLAVLLRLSVVLHRGRGPEPIPEVDLEVSGRELRIGISPEWLDRHPLTRADLDEEGRFLAAAGYRLRVNGE
jgi:exopolyphosphatase/guanosine-5'-triphosphate,3'-diphosphate pyrophosphatase